jgi:hypothetical protein
MAVWKPQQHAVFYTILLGTITLALEYATGPYIRFPILFILPVLLASWYHGWALGVGAAVLLPTLRLGLEWHWDATTPWTMTEPIINTLVRMAVLVTIAYMAARLSQERKALQEEVRTLRGLLPICMVCKKIRDDQGNWESLEDYIMRHTEANFTHGLCPTCLQEHYSHYITSEDN